MYISDDAKADNLPRKIVGGVFGIPAEREIGVIPTGAVAGDFWRQVLNMRVSLMPDQLWLCCWSDSHRDTFGCRPTYVSESSSP